ncbi:MAG: carbohydrate ABC transporter permease [Oscillochloridaceae bacterium umkhey_bin13]
MRRKQSYRTQQLLTYAASYAVLAIFGFLILFPFLFMFFTALKLPGDVFRSPPRLLPFSQEQIVIEAESFPLYRVEVDGQTQILALIDRGSPVVIVASVDDPEQIFERAPREARPVGGFANQESVVIDGQERKLWEIEEAGQTLRVFELSRGNRGVFADPADPSRTVESSLNDATPVEQISFATENFSRVLELQSIDRSLTNTMLVTILVVLGQVITSVLGGYAFARLQFPGRDSLFLVYLGTIMIPFVVLIIPMYQLMVIVGWVDRIAALILPWIFTAYGTFLMRQFFISIPKDLEEAALMDGASRLRILWQVFVPLAGPAIATQATFTFLYAWNSFVWPLIVINTGNFNNQVLTLSLMVLQGRAADSPALVMAGTTIAVSVPLLIFVLAQRYFVEGIATTGIK